MNDKINEGVNEESWVLSFLMKQPFFNYLDINSSSKKKFNRTIWQGRRRKIREDVPLLISFFY